MALREALRVTRRGGVIYLSFGPIWTAYSGSHFMHLLPEPWKHLLLSQDEYCTALFKAGGTAEQASDFVHGLNRKLPSTYKSQFPEVLTEERVQSFKQFSWGPGIDASIEQHPNILKAAERLEIDPEDLLIQGFSFVIVR